MLFLYFSLCQSRLKSQHLDALTAVCLPQKLIFLDHIFKPPSKLCDLF
jgi:hypothetical protein